MNVGNELRGLFGQITIGRRVIQHHGGWFAIEVRDFHGFFDRPNIERTGLGRNQDEVGSGCNRLGGAGGVGRCVNEQQIVSVVADFANGAVQHGRDFPAHSWKFTLRLAGALSKGGPVFSTTLVVHVENGDAVACLSCGNGQVGGEGGFPDAPFLRHDSDDFQGW